MLEKDFMAEVLKRFDKIDAKLDEHSNEFKEIHVQLDEHSKTLKEHSQILDEHSNIIKSLKDTVHENTKYIIENSKKIDVNSKKIDDLSKVVNAHNRILIHFETEINKKISTLFDSFIYHQDKHTIYERNLDTLNRESFNYDVRISALEDLSKIKLAQ